MQTQWNVIQGRTATRSSRSRAGRRGFSFTEILFAVMILGIGFIMVAAIFPVAIKQTALTGEDTRGTAMAVTGASAMQSLATNQNFRSGFLPADPEPSAGAPVNGAPLTIGSRVWTFHDARFDPAIADQVWAAVAGNMIYASDPRYAWIPMYRRDMVLNPGVNRATATKNDYSLSPTAQLIMIGVQTRNHSRYDPFRDLQRFNTAGSSQQAVLEPAPVAASLTPSGSDYPGSPAKVTFNYQGSGSDLPGRAAEGTYLVISDDGLGYPQDGNGYYNGYNGRILRVGNYRADLSKSGPLSPVFELAPGYDINTNLKATVLMIGRGYANPQVTLGGFEGGVQDIAVYTTFVRIQ